MRSRCGAAVPPRSPRRGHRPLVSTTIQGKTSRPAGRASSDGPVSPEGVPVPRLAANLSLMFTELPFLDRFQAAARVGFKAVEFQFPYDHPAADIASRLR